MAVDQHLIGKLEQQGIAGALVGKGIVTTLAKCIPEQQIALSEVDQVLPAIACAGDTQAPFSQWREQSLLALTKGIEQELPVQML